MDFFDLRFDSKSSSLFFKNSNDLNQLMIFAHKNELLIDHIQKTKYIFNNLKDDDVFYKFYKYFYNEEFLSMPFEMFINVIEDFVFFHDIGKLSFNFQINRLNKNNEKIKSKQKEFLSKYNMLDFVDYFEVNHSFSGALLFLSKYESIINDNVLFMLLLAYSIYGHHTSLKDLYSEEEFTYNFSNKDLNTISSILMFLNIASKEEIENCDFDQRHFQDIQNLIYNNKTPNDSTFSFFYNYIYSLLISADVLASREYNKNLIDVKKINFDNRITEDIKIKMINAFFSVEYNNNLSYDEYILNLEEIDDINSLRKNMLLESSYNLNEIIKSINHNKIFFLNLPTGGGKTNTSMKLALDLIENTNANRIIYAMPFINIIEQNYNIIKNNFNLSEDGSEIRKIYSATETIFNQKDDEFKSKIILQDNFFNYPVICTTFSTLFDSILRTKKGYKYKVASLANSIIILDEIQSLPLVNWNSLYYLINEIAEKYNIYFIIMSATLPQFHKLKIDYENNLFYENANILIKSPKNYFNHYLFDRTVINGEVESLSITDKNQLKDYLIEKIFYNFSIGYNKGLIVLNTIKSSKLIYELLNEFDEFEVDLLNSSLLSHIKQNIIYKINNMGNDKSKKYILVSTQSIEAGVDVSFDFVIRDFAVLDSIEQVRGRCNRSRELNINNPYKKGNVYLINLKDRKSSIHKYIYNDHEIKSRILETFNLFNANLNYKYEDIEDYYNRVSEDINTLEDDKEVDFIINDRDNIRNWNNLEFSKLQDKYGIHIIDNKINQFSIFIPINMSIINHDIEELSDISNMPNIKLSELYEFYEENFIFSYKELEFLKLIEEKDSCEIIQNNCVNGRLLVDYYKNIILNYEKDINAINIIQKEFSSIINKFLINISINNDEVNDEIKYEFEKVGFFYIMDEKYIGDDDESLYSIEKGLNYYPQIIKIL